MAKMYGLKKGIAIETLLFKFDGEEMDDYDTPESLGLTDHDKIEVLIKENKTNRMTIRIKNQVSQSYHVCFIRKVIELVIGYDCC